MDLGKVPQLVLLIQGKLSKGKAWKLEAWAQKNGRFSTNYVAETAV